MKSFLGVLVVLSMLAGGAWFFTRPTVYNFGNGAELVVPLCTFSSDMRKDGCGICVESGTNVTVRNNSAEWRTLTVSFRTPGCSILSNHAFEDLAPKSSKTFGAESSRYTGMYVSVSDYAQKKRNVAD